MDGISFRKCRILPVIAAFCSLIAIGCTTSSSVGGYSQGNGADSYTQSNYPAGKNHAAQAGGSEAISGGITAGSITTIGSETESVNMEGGTELWLFGPINHPGLTTPLGARGVRTIIDMRNLPLDQAMNYVKVYADRGLGLAICLRWRNPSSGKTKVAVTKNYDVPPTPEEADRVIAQLTKLFGSDEAKRIGDRLFVQFYNEVGGGPGTIKPDQADELFAFATRATAEIRKVNSLLRICGPAVTGAQLQPRQKMNTAKSSAKAAVIGKAITWAAEYADVIDLHLHAVDGEWTRAAAQNLRDNLDRTARGKTVGLVSFEWSCARYPDRNNEQGVINAILGIWKTMNDFNFLCAAYGPYWPLKNKANDKVADMFGWVSIVDTNGKRNQPIYDTLQKIGGGNGIDEPSGSGSKIGKRQKKRRRK